MMAFKDKSLHDLVTHVFAALEAKDVDAVLNVFAEDGVLVDPHFPTPRMQGKEAIGNPMRKLMNGMKSFGYTIVNYCESENGLCAAAEVATQHVMQTGKSLNFPQLFMFEVADGRITRMQAYEPYGPKGRVEE